MMHPKIDLQSAKYANELEAKWFRQRLFQMPVPLTHAPLEKCALLTRVDHPFANVPWDTLGQRKKTNA